MYVQCNFNIDNNPSQNRLALSRRRSLTASHRSRQQAFQMYSTKWLVIFVLLAVLQGCRSFRASALRRVSVAKAVNPLRSLEVGRKFSRLYARKVNDLEDFPGNETSFFIKFRTFILIRFGYCRCWTDSQQRCVEGRPSSSVHSIWSAWYCWKRQCLEALARTTCSGRHSAAGDSLKLGKF